MRSWTSSARTWRDRATVDPAVRAWAAALAQGHPQPPIRCIGYFGSYARGDLGFGSDVDLIVIVEEDSTPWMLRPLRYDTITLPVRQTSWSTPSPSGRRSARNRSGGRSPAKSFGCTQMTVEMIYS